MNAFWKRADGNCRLKSMFAVLLRELEEEVCRKKAEIDRFDDLSEDLDALATYRRDSGLTREVCGRILGEVCADLEQCRILLEKIPEMNAVDGEKDLKTLYRETSDVKTVWTASAGQKPVDLMVVRPDDASVLLGDCKFGIKSDTAWIIRNRCQFEKEFESKFVSVGCVLKANDGVDSRPEMLLVASSALAPLLKNRIDDYKLDPQCASIPYDRVRVCTVGDIYETCRSLLVWSFEG